MLSSISVIVLMRKVNYNNGEKNQGIGNFSLFNNINLWANIYLFLIAHINSGGVEYKTFKHEYFWKNTSTYSNFFESTWTRSLSTGTALFKCTWVWVLKKWYSSTIQILFRVLHYWKPFCAIKGLISSVIQEKTSSMHM